MQLGIPQQQKQSNFPKIVEQSAPVETGMYKAVFCRFVTLGFQNDDFNEGQVKFKTSMGFELVEDMAGNKIPDHVKKFDDGSVEQGPKCIFRDYPMADMLHHKSGAYAVAMAMAPETPTITKGKENEHRYIQNFDWPAHFGKTVLLQITKKQAKKPDENGNPKFYNKLESVMPLGMPLEQRTENMFFNLYDPDMQDAWDKLNGFEKKQIRESVRVPGEPVVVYIQDDAPAQEQPKQEQPAEAKPKVDFDDDLPF